MDITFHTSGSKHKQSSIPAIEVVEKSKRLTGLPRQSWSRASVDSACQMECYAAENEDNETALIQEGPQGGSCAQFTAIKNSKSRITAIKRPQTLTLLMPWRCKHFLFISRPCRPACSEKERKHLRVLTNEQLKLSIVFEEKVSITTRLTVS